MKAVILAAGKGTRLRPLTHDTPKPLIQVGNTTILGWTLQQLSKIKDILDEIIVIIGYQHEKIENWLKENDFGIPVITIIQEEQLGTAHALLLAKNSLKGEKFIFTYGDILLNSTDWQVFLNEVRTERTRDINLLTAREVEHPERFGVIEVGADGTIINIVEKPSDPPSNLINSGLMLFDDSIFQGEDQLKPSERGELELPDLINIHLRKGSTYRVVPIKGWWIDTGYPWNLLEANQFILEEIVSPQGHVDPTARIDPNVHLEGPVHVGPKVHVRSGAYIIGPAFIDEGSTIGPNCFIRPSTFVGKHCRIGNAVEIKNSIILDHTNVGHLSYVGDSYIGKNCNFGAGTKVANLRLDSGMVNMIVKNKKMSTGRKKLGIFMGNNVKTGINVSLMPGIKLGPNSAVGAHALIMEDVPPNTLVYVTPNGELASREWPLRKRHEKKE